MSTAPLSIKPSAVLQDIDWGTYTRLLRAFERRRRFRLTYDRGTCLRSWPKWGKRARRPWSPSTVPGFGRGANPASRLIQ